MWFFAWFYINSIVSPARRDIFVTSQGTDSYYLAGTTTTTTTTTTNNNNNNNNMLSYRGNRVRSVVLRSW